jgi:hypothetical protein
MATQIPDEILHPLRNAMPGQSWDWYLRIGQMIYDGLMPMPGVPAPPKPKPNPAQPIAPPSAEAKARLLSICKTPERARLQVEQSRQRGDTEDQAWRRAYDDLMEERMKLYAGIL